MHIFRPDTAKKIEWVKHYSNVFDVKQKGPEKGAEASPAPAPPAKAPDSPMPRKTEPAAAPPPVSPAPAQKAVGDPPPPPPPPPAEGIREITVEEAMAEHQNGTPFLDARRTSQFKRGHIPGARSVSIWEAGLDGRIEALFGEIAFDTPVVLYCSSGDCEDSHNLATSMKTAGYKDLRIMKGGFPEWVKKGQPVEKDPGAAPAGEAKEEEE